MKFGIVGLLFLISSHFFGQINWQSVEVQSGERLHKMHVFDSLDAVVAGYGNTLKKTNDGGLSWNDVNLPDTIIKIGPVDFIDMEFSGDTGYLVNRRIIIKTNGQPDFYINSQLLVSYNKGNDWQVLDYSGISDGTNNALTDAMADSSYNVEIFSLGVRGPGKLHIAVTWSDKTNQTSHSLVFATNDNGATWVKAVDVDFGSTIIQAFNFKGNRGYFGANKVFYETMDGTNWQNRSTKITLANAGDDVFFINDFEFAGDDLLIATAADGVFKYDAQADTAIKISPSGSNDLLWLGEGNILSVSSSTKTSFTRNWGTSWAGVSAGSTLWESGGIMGDHIFALGTGNIYYFNMKDLALPVQQTRLTAAINLIHISPNSFALKTSGTGAYRLYTSNGICLSSTRLVKNQTRINLNGYPKGIYLLTVQLKGEPIKTFKLLVK